ncbi:ATPase [Micrococcus sp. ACRRV]|uniref:AAA family ATPase n=1 Tax=Micrococcus sp. ACRRV TaxID=2918203 RepID=UPI001EF32245|nr:ATPase [Micrococcus sp. ACRRV]
MRVALATTLMPGRDHVGPLEQAQAEVTVVRRAEDLAELLAAARSGLVDAVLVAGDLSALARGFVDEVREAPRPVAVVAMGEVRAERERVRTLGVPCLSADADPLALAAAVQSAVRARLTGARPELGSETPPADPPAPAPGTPDGGDPEAVRVAAVRDREGTPRLPEPNPVRVDALAASEVDALFTEETSPVAAADEAGPASPEAAGADAVTASPADTAPEDGAEGGPERGRTGRTVAVWGPTGAPGRTTVAVNLAAESAVAGLRTLLVDLDTYGPSVGVHLGLTEETAGLARAVHRAERGSVTREDLVDAAVRVRVAGGDLDVLTGLTRPDRWPEVRPGALREVLQAARDGWDRVVLDLGFCVEEDEELSFDVPAPQRNGATLAGLAAADRVLVVGGADAVAMPRLLRAVEALPAGVEPDRVRVVVNRVRPQASGVAPQAQVAGVWERYGPPIPLVAQLPWDPGAADRALLGGQVLAEAAPGSALRAAVLELARLDPAVAARTQNAGRGRRPAVRGLRRRLAPWSAPSPRTP